MKAEHHAINLQRVGMRRRKKEVLRMKIMAGLMVLFLALTLLFQDNMNHYQMEMNYRNYGEWLIREPVSSDISHPYLEHCGEIWTGGGIYRGQEGKASEQLQVDPSDNSLYTGKTIGRLTPDIIQTGYIRLYEGKFPEKDNEIAMELSALQALGCDYDLGQEITLYTAENENITDLILKEEKMTLKRETFVLVGTIRSYTGQWNEGDALPNAIITENAFAKINMQKHGYRFLRLKKEYVDERVASFAIEVMDSVRETLTKKVKGGLEQNGYSFNTFAYYNAFWSNKTMYRNMIMILIVLGASVMSYLMSSYLSKRKKFYYRMREIGATAAQVFRMTVYECVYSVLYTAIAVLALSYGMSFVLVFAVAKAAAIPFFYVFRFETLCLIVVSVAAVLLLAMLCAYLLLRKKRLTDNRNRLSRLAERRIRRRAKKKRKRKLAVQEMEKRYRMSHSFSVVFVRIIGIGVCVSVLACLMQINRNANAYKYARTDYVDFTVQAKRVWISMDEDVPVKPYKGEDGKMVDSEYMGWGCDEDSMRQRIPESLLQDLRELSGIRHISYATYDNFHWFDWEGKEESEYFQHRLWEEMGSARRGENGEYIPIEIDTSTDKGREYVEKTEKQRLYQGRYYHDCAEVWEDLSPHLKKTKASYEDFCDGDEVILLERGLESDMEENKVTGEIIHSDRYIDRDQTLNEGDMLTIHTEGKDVTVRIGAILFCEELGNQYGYSAYGIIGSEALAKRIAAEEKFSFGYNHLKIDFNAFYNSEATDKIITRQCVQNNLSYDSEAEYIRASYTRLVQSAIVYGTLAAIITILYLFIVSCVLQEERQKKQKQWEAFHQLGVPWKRLRQQDFRNGFREMLYLLISIPVLCIIWIMYLRADYTDDITGYTSLFFHKTIYVITEQKYVFYALFDEINIIWVGVYLLLLGASLLVLHVRKK